MRSLWVTACNRFDCTTNNNCVQLKNYGQLADGPTRRRQLADV